MSDIFRAALQTDSRAIGMEAYLYLRTPGKELMCQDFGQLICRTVTPLKVNSLDRGLWPLQACRFHKSGQSA